MLKMALLATATEVSGDQAGSAMWKVFQLNGDLLLVMALDFTGSFLRKEKKSI